MAITAFTSTAIIDATTIGTTVLTASSAGIAADAIGLGATDDVTFNSVDAANGDFSGDVTVSDHILGGSSGHAIKLSSSLVGESSLKVADTGSAVLAWGYNGTNYAYIRATFYPVLNGVYSIGKSTRRWSNVYGVNGSFTGNLVSETGGSYKLYNLGTGGDADTEYFEIAFLGNVATLSAKATGSGSVRDLNFNGHDGNFSGNVTMSGLPTSDPLVAGQLWNDSGTVKISAG